MAAAIFVSHSTQDDDFVKSLRVLLEEHGQSVWVDSRALAPGDKLNREIEQAINDAEHFLVVMSFAAMGSKWVKQEVALAQSLGLNVIPLLLDEITFEHIEHLFEQEPVYLRCTGCHLGLQSITPQLFSGLELALPNDAEPTKVIQQRQVDELFVKLTSPKVNYIDDDQSASAEAVLVVKMAGSSEPIYSPKFIFNAPFGRKAGAEIQWYIETYYQWPSGVFKQRALELEQQLPKWGKALFDALFNLEQCKDRLKQWLAGTGDKRFSVEVDGEPLAGSSDEQAKQHRQGATLLLSLPWEVIRGEGGYWFETGNEVAIRRNVPKLNPVSAAKAELPIRVLLLAPRPEVDEHGHAVGYIDHRTSAKALLQATDELGGGLIEVELLSSPTFAGLKQALQQGKERGKRYDVVHFDGHGIYDPQVGLGGLCFEREQEQDLNHRQLDLVYADKLAEQMYHYNIPVFFLDACQTALTHEDPKASVATSLLNQGVGAVVAMSHSVLVATAKRFVEPFYQALAQGLPVTKAMLAGQQQLFKNSYRFKVMGAGELHLQDWLVPVLYQEQHDPQLFPYLPSEAMVKLEVKRRQLQLNELPAPPEHGFVGRSHILLLLERHLQQQQSVVLKGSGGMGKTALACELCRWEVQTRRMDKAVFINVESHNVQDIKGVLQVIGRQLVPHYSSAEYASIERALQPITRALNDYKVILLVDNMESVLPDGQGNSPTGVTDVSELLALCQQLLDDNKQTRIVFTTREALPAPFASGKNLLELQALETPEAIELVEQVMAEHGWQPPANDDATTPAQISALVEAVNCHPRALVLLARAVAQDNKQQARLGGVKQTTADIGALMTKLNQQNPGDRENSLYASVELSLQRLPDEIRQVIKPLAVFHGGGHLSILAYVMQLEAEQAGVIAGALIEVGMAQAMKHNYLRLDPALAHYLRLDMGEQELAASQQRWLTAMMELVNFLYQQQFKDGPMAMQLALLELGNLQAMVGSLTTLLAGQSEQTELAAQVSDTAGRIEQLMQKLGRKQLQHSAAKLRQQAADLLAGQQQHWSHAQFVNAHAAVKSAMAAGDVNSALTKAQALLQQVCDAGEQAYERAGYDIAMAHLLFGRLLKMAGQAGQALPLLQQAENQFSAFAEGCENKQQQKDAEHMASVCLTEQGDCLRDLGQLDEAIAKYQQSIETAKQLKDIRQQATGQNQLATALRMRQDYPKALAAYQAAQKIFEQLNEPQSLATIYHQMGIVYQDIGKYGLAEQAYRQALDIKTRLNDLGAQASTLTQLGNLYYVCLGKSEAALDFYHQALEVAIKLEDKQNEGRARGNIASTLISMGQFSEAKTQIVKAIECKQPLGHVAELWKSYEILRQIELSLNLEAEAQEAKQQAIACYLGYRLQGGYPQTPVGQLAEGVLQLIKAEQKEQVQSQLQQLIEADDSPDELKRIASKLLLLVEGQRDSTLADDPELDYDDASEILWLLEQLK